MIILIPPQLFVASIIVIALFAHAFTAAQVHVERSAVKSVDKFTRKNIVEKHEKYTRASSRTGTGSNTGGSRDNLGPVSEISRDHGQ